MAELIGGKVKLDNGQTVTPQQGAWYDARQYWGGTLSAPGVINSLSNQQGAGQAVSQEVNKQTSVAAGLDPNANQDYINKLNAKPATATPSATIPTGLPAGASITGSSGGFSGGASAYPTLNLPDLYKTLYDSSGISAIEAELAQKTKEYTEQTGIINDNPFLSEATRVGRVAKLDKLFQDRTANLRNDIATKKADIETKLNLETKQFDINNAAAKQALDQFNTLLSMGALDGASGEDIAKITYATGLSSGAIQSAINANKAKNVQTSVQTETDNDGNVTAFTINTQTGEIINQTSLGNIGKATKGSGGGGSANTGTQKTSDQFLADAKTIKAIDTPQGRAGQFPLLVAQYAPFMSLQQIYNLYAQTDLYKKYGPPKESAADIQELYNEYRGK